MDAADTVDGFAQRMRALKDRSGLSYGALASRLHVSTSTLHRYCNGDAVPTEFAPVERLGRLCGASREELVELHRAWILADEARRRGKAEPAPEPTARRAEPAPGPVPEPALRPEAASGPAPGPVPGPEAVSGPAPGTEAVPEPAPGPAPGPAARQTGAGPVELAADPVVEEIAGPSGTPHRGRRARRGALAVAAVVALAVPAAYLVGRVGERPTATPGGSPASPAPLSAGVSSYNWAAPCGQYYVLDQEPRHVPPPPPPQDTRGWARALGGIDGGHMQLQLTVTGRTQEPVVLTALHVRVVERGTPLDRAAYSMGDGCGSGVTPQTFDVDLDAPRPYVKPVAGQDGDRVVPAKDFPYKVATGDPQVLNLDVHTEEYAASWYLELHWSSGADKGVVRVDDGGEPFRTSAIEGRPTYGYWPDKGEWVTQ
ncbi:helix-turn-helix transcriptional regulator [Streptomyces sp. NPDC126499]|uniref:helix-turn-helix domain-containing protein n=1 Tax=Streptomyces sp. NPDC126499 TaxID=3155314 RepID=UPI00332D0223